MCDTEYDLYRDLFFKHEGGVRSSTEEIDLLCKSDLIAFLNYIAACSMLSKGDIGTLLKMRRGIMWCQSTYRCMFEASNTLWKCVRRLDEAKYSLVKSLPIQLKKPFETLFSLFATNVAAASSRRRRIDKCTKGPSKSQTHFTVFGFRVACEGMPYTLNW